MHNFGFRIVSLSLENDCVAPSSAGSPIHVKQNPNPTNEELAAYQKKYIDELMRIWNGYKDVYARNRTRELRLVE